MKYLVGTSSMLGVILTVLKLAGAVDWSWWVVTAPFWPIVGYLIVFSIAVIAFETGSLRDPNTKPPPEL